MKVDTCPYCQRGSLLKKFGYLAYKTDTSLIIVFKEQSHPGRLIVAYRHNHVGEIIDLDPVQRNKFMRDVADAAKLIRKIYKPMRINYGAYGDTLGHLHVHLVPKNESEDEWGTTFSMNPHKVEIDDEQCALIAERLNEEYQILLKEEKEYRK